MYPDRDPGPTLTVAGRDGVRLCLRHLGGVGPDLLICHATGFHGWAYGPMASYLTGSFRVWTLDFRGHGLSGEPANGDYDWRAMGCDVEACVDAIGADTLYGFGHSMGGAALMLAELARAGTFAGFFFYEPIAPPPDALTAEAENLMIRTARKRREVFDDRAKARARYASRPPLDVLRSDVLDAYVETGFVDRPDGRVRLACRAETEARTFAGRHMIFDRLAEVEVATTVAAGTVPGEPAPGLFAAAIAENLPLGRLLRYQGLGHFGPLQAPDVVAVDVAPALLDSGRGSGIRSGIRR